MTCGDTMTPVSVETCPSIGLAPMRLRSPPKASLEATCSSRTLSTVGAARDRTSSSAKGTLAARATPRENGLSPRQHPHRPVVAVLEHDDERAGGLVAPDDDSAIDRSPEPL
jgi:hypothetical protein